jgi:hypothetical protein
MVWIAPMGEASCDARVQWAQKENGGAAFGYRVCYALQWQVIVLVGANRKRLQGKSDCQWHLAARSSLQTAIVLTIFAAQQTHQ